MMSDNAGRISDYQDLSDLAKTMVRILAINIAPCRLYAVLKCLTDLGYINEKTGKPFHARTIQPVQTDLIAKGLLLKSVNGISCPESIRKHAVYDTLMEDAFPELAGLIQRHIPTPRYNNATKPIVQKQQSARDFQIALFFTDAMAELDEISMEDWVALFPQTLADPFLPEIIEKINPEIRFAVLENLLRALTVSLEPAKEVVAYINKKYLAGLSDFVSLSSLFLYYQACGDTVGAGTALNRLDETKFSAEKRCYLGWLAFIQGCNEKALDHFNASLKRLKLQTRKRKLFFTGYVGLFHLLCLLRTGENTHFNQALEYIDIAEKNNYPLFAVMTNFKAVFSEQLGLPAHDQCDIGLYRHDLAPLDMFIVILTLSWVDRQMAKARIPLLNRARDKAERNGYPWFAAELSALLASLGHDPKKNAETAARLHGKCKTVSFVDMVKNRPKWEKRLNGLLAITAAEQTTAPDRPADQRLIWLFSHDETYNYWQITPRMQKKSKKGGWTQGRPVALKNLHDNHHDMPGLTDQDRRICQTIKEEYYRTSWRYGKTEYLLDSQRTLPALVDHPLLFLQDSPGVNVELVMTEPEIRITRKNGKLKLVLFPTPQSEAGIQVVRDTPTRFKVIRFSEKHQEISDYLGEGLSIPKKGEKLAREVADALSAVVTVQSDLETTQKIKTIAADSRPHAHITPYKAGVQLEFLVKPFGDDGSSFRPGRGGKNVLTEIKGKRVQAARDFAGEKRRQQAVIQDCPTLDRLAKMDNQWQAQDPEDSLELLLELKECGDDVVMEWPRGEKLTVRREVSFNNLSMYIRKERDWFKATGTLAIDDATSLDLRRLLDMLSRATGRFIPLDDGTFLAITGQLRKRLSELRAFSDDHGKGVRFAPLAALALEDMLDEAGQLKSDKAWKEHCRHLNQMIKPRVPSTLQGSLRDYQKEGFGWLAQLSHWQVGGCLADDMGLGKTVQALSAILLRTANGPTLVVAPLSVTTNWQEEARRFAPTLNVIIFGPGDRQKTMDNLQAFDLLIVSYGLLPLETDLLSGIKWQTIVLDEAQAIKNAKTKRSRAAMKLQAEFRIITTGTPVENHLGELWTLFHFLNPGLLGGFKKFNERFAIPIERDQDTETRNRLRKLIRPFILRRLKSDVLQELPPKTEITLTVEMSHDELILYEAQRLQALESIDKNKDEGAGQNHLRILGEIMKLRRLCCNPSLALPDCQITSSKLKVFGDTVGELLANNHKALVFSQFVGHLTLIGDYLDKNGISYQYLDGSTPIKKRKQRIDNFQNGEGELFLISLKAGGFGLNLTAADYVIHMDPWWNPAVEDQASDRVHRIGQDRPVTVYRLVVKNTIEEQIIELHNQKRDLADSLLAGTDVAGKVSTRELLGLLQGEERQLS